MDNIKLKGKTIEHAYGKIIDIVPAFLEKWTNGKGYILSEADIGLLGVRNFKNAPELMNNYYGTSTLSATKKDIIKVILSYDNLGNHQLTDIAGKALGWINPNEKLVNHGINLDIENRWEKLKGSGVYTLKRKGLILNEDLTESEAMKHELLLTKLGHPDYVDSKFARPIEEVEEIISGIFKLGKDEHGYTKMMAQNLTSVDKKGILKAWYVNRLNSRARSYARTNLDNDDGRFAFYSVGDAKTNAKGVNVDKARNQLKELKKVVNVSNYPIEAIEIAINERDVAQEKLSKLTLDKIYSTIKGEIGSDNEDRVRNKLEKILN